MAIKNSNQNWEVGQRINVGFLKGLTVIRVDAIKDYKPDIYTLQSDKGILYQFTPHWGIRRI